MNRIVVPKGHIRRHMRKMRGHIVTGAPTSDSGARAQAMEDMARMPLFDVTAGQQELAGYIARAADSQPR